MKSTELSSRSKQLFEAMKPVVKAMANNVTPELILPTNSSPVTSLKIKLGNNQKLANQLMSQISNRFPGFPLRFDESQMKHGALIVKLIPDRADEFLTGWDGTLDEKPAVNIRESFIRLFKRAGALNGIHYYQIDPLTNDNKITIYHCDEDGASKTISFLGALSMSADFGKKTVTALYVQLTPGTNYESLFTEELTAFFKTSPVTPPQPQPTPKAEAVQAPQPAPIALQNINGNATTIAAVTMLLNSLNENERIELAKSLLVNWTNEAEKTALAKTLLGDKHVDEVTIRKDEAQKAETRVLNYIKGHMKQLLVEKKLAIVNIDGNVGLTATGGISVKGVTHETFVDFFKNTKISSN